MSKRKRGAVGLTIAQKFSKLLLYEASGGNMGTKPEVNIENQTMTFGEKRGFLDSLIKIAEMERKNAADAPEESGWEQIRNKMNASREGSDRGNGRGSPEGGSNPFVTTDEDEDAEDIGAA